jgi:hypothetical protein
LKSETSNLDKDIEGIKQSFSDHKLPIDQFIMILKQKVLKRHDLITIICKKLAKVENFDKPDLISSATSTPINCKSMFSSVNNSSLKKRDYK